jgi:hypothetical protein
MKLLIAILVVPLFVGTLGWWQQRLLSAAEQVLAGNRREEEGWKILRWMAVWRVCAVGFVLYCIGLSVVVAFNFLEQVAR